MILHKQWMNYKLFNNIINNINKLLPDLSKKAITQDNYTS